LIGTRHQRDRIHSSEKGKKRRDRKKKESLPQDKRAPSKPYHFEYLLDPGVIILPLSLYKLRFANEGGKRGKSAKSFLLFPHPNLRVYEEISRSSSPLPHSFFQAPYSIHTHPKHVQTQC
jgi:hypothetical protein